MTVLQPGVLVTLRGTLVHAVLRSKVSVDNDCVRHDPSGHAIYETALRDPTAVTLEDGGLLDPCGQS